MEPVVAAPSSSWTERFQVLRKLAAGSFGVVYLAHDRRRGTNVALKLLREATGADLYRFKREFRGLADIAHPNLVTLHELHHADGQWLFSMEYVPGMSFIDWVRPRIEGPAQSPEGPPVLKEGEPTATMQLPRHRSTVDRPALLQEHFEQTFHQLVDGVYALHVTGRLHRDLKPSNVLVTPDGRVVLLDFGLTGDFRRLSSEHTHDSSSVGTPLYMSPEQADDEPLGPASDWYSVGCMLYEALTGHRPFEGQPVMVLESKRNLEPRPPRELAPDVPEHLDALCRRLLARDPQKRPDGKEILAMLGRAPSVATLELASSIVPRFVGRRTELDALGRAFEDARHGRPIAVIVRGSSGMGKSALVREFLDEVAMPAGALVLQGRCYERESVPYKGLDSVIDELTTYLVQQPADVLDALLPAEIQGLARLFPVLRRVRAIADAPVWIMPPDPQELRRRAFGALRSLLEAIGRRVPLVVYVDDVQWGDADAASFLSDLIIHHEPPSMLLVAACRLEEEESSLLVQSLRQRRPAGGGEIREVVLAGFSSDEANELVASMRPAGTDRGDVSQLLTESSGNPLFLSELARAQGDRKTTAGLDELLSSRVDRLPEDARRLFETCAVVGRPIPVETALRAAGLMGEGTALAILQRERLLRVRGRDVRLVEPYHDRVRETAVARMSAGKLRDLHRRLAESFEVATPQDPEALTRHWHGAGELDKAMRWALVAAQAAVDTYAFNRATTLYGQVLAFPALSEQQRVATKVKLAHSLANAGRVREAATAFAECAAMATGDEQLQLRRHQLDQILCYGDLAEGRALARELLHAIGIEMPSTHRAALLDVVVSRAALRIRGLKFKPRPAAEVPASVLQRLDVLWSIATGIGLLDPILGRALQGRFIRKALAAGEPERAIKALSLEVGFRGLAGEPSWAGCEALYRRTIALAEQSGTPNVVVHASTALGLAAFMSGRFDVALERFVKGSRDLRDSDIGYRYQVNISETFRVGCLLYLGRIRELIRVLENLVREAEESGDAHALRCLYSYRGNLAWVLQDRPEVARRNLEAVSITRAPDETYNLHHYYVMVSRTQIDLYSGDLAAAGARVDAEMKLLDRSMLLRIQSVRIESRHLRGRIALARAASSAKDSKEQREQCEVALAMAKRIEKEQVPWGAGLASLLRAGVANIRGDRAESERSLRAAVDGLSKAHMALYANVARRCLGRLVGGDEGTAFVSEAEAWMTEEGIRAPASVCTMLAPGA